MIRTKNSDAAPLYPRVYRPGKMTHILFSSFAAFSAVFTVRGLLNHPAIPGTLLVLLPIWSGAFLLVYLVNQQVILYDDAIEKITWFSRRTFKRDEILGWYRLARAHGGYTYFFIPHDKRARKMRLDPLFRWDSVFFQWQRDIPQLKR